MRDVINIIAIVNIADARRRTVRLNCSRPSAYFDSRKQNHIRDVFLWWMEAYRHRPLPLHHCMRQAFEQTSDTGPRHGDRGRR